MFVWVLSGVMLVALIDCFLQAGNAPHNAITKTNNIRFIDTDFILNAACLYLLWVGFGKGDDCSSEDQEDAWTRGVNKLLLIPVN